MTYFAFSDILGNHKIQLGTEMVLTLEDSDYYLSYAYLKNKTLYIESNSAEETEALRYEERNIMKLLSRINIFPDKVRFRTTIGN